MKSARGLTKRFRECRRCHGTNTEQVGMVDDNYKLVYVAWCFDCRDDFGYTLYMDTVYDKQERI